MRIDTDQYLTINEAAKTLGMPRRTLYRAIERAREAGQETVVEVLGRPCISRKSLPVISAHYYPWNSPEHHRMARQWGAKGGTQKAANRRKRS